MKFKTLLLIILISLLAKPSFANLYVNEEKIPSVLEDNTTYAPVRDLSEALGANVSWFQDDQTIIISKDPKDIPENRVKGLSLEIDGEVIETKLLRDKNKVLAPVRLVAEKLGAVVYWDNSTTTVLNPTKVPLKTKENMLKEPYIFTLEASLNKNQITGSGVQKNSEAYINLKTAKDNIEIYVDKDKYYYKLKEKWLLNGVPIEEINPRTYIQLLNQAKLKEPQLIHLSEGDQEVYFYINQNLRLSKITVLRPDFKLSFIFK